MRPLIGSDEHGELICGPCAGTPGLDYTCRECGRGGEIHSERRCYRCVLAGRARHLAGDVSVPLPPRSDPVRLLGEDDHIHQLDRCLSDDSMPLDLRVGGALVLLFGLLVSRVMQLTRNDVSDDGEVTYLDIDTYRLMLPPGSPASPASSVTRTISDGHSPASEPPRRGCSPGRARLAPP
ncbi:MAG TPA: hypothetical protein VGA04_30845 [Streptosporangiaceae bacterium]